MKKIILALGLGLITAMSFAQNIQKAGEGTNLYLEKNGKKIVKEKFEKIGGYNSKAGLIPAKLNGKWGFYDNDGKLVIPHQYGLYCDDLGCWYGMGFIKVGMNGEKGIFIDKTGKEVEFPYEVFIDISAVGGECYFTVRDKDGKYALANDEKALTPFIYDMIVKRSSNPLTFNAVKDKTTYIIDANGQVEGEAQSSPSSTSSNSSKEKDKYKYVCEGCGSVEIVEGDSRPSPNKTHCKSPATANSTSHKWKMMGKVK